MNFDYEALRFWVYVVHLLGTVFIGIYVWLSRRQSVTAERIGKLEEDMDRRLDTHGDRLTQLEVRAGAAPTHDDLKRIYQRLDTMNGEFKELRGEFASAGKTLGLIHDYLLNHRSGQ